MSMEEQGFSRRRGRQAPDPREATEEHSFDTLAKEMADDAVSRGRALKYFGAAILASMLSIGTLTTPLADAKGKKKKKKHRRHTPSALSCGPNNCSDGCCAGNKCLLPSAQSDALCGRTGGLACTQCSPGSSCVDGNCVGNCGPNNCSGCCTQLSGVCIQLNDQTKNVCGNGGATCKSCGPSSLCLGGVCEEVTTP